MSLVPSISAEALLNYFGGGGEEMVGGWKDNKTPKNPSQWRSV